MQNMEAVDKLFILSQIFLYMLDVYVYILHTSMCRFADVNSHTDTLDFFEEKKLCTMKRFRIGFCKHFSALAPHLGLSSVVLWCIFLAGGPFLILFFSFGKPFDFLWFLGIQRCVSPLPNASLCLLRLQDVLQTMYRRQKCQK